MSGLIKPPVMGLDVGKVRIGVALSDALHMTAQAHSVIHRTRLKEDLKAIEEIIRDRGVETIVVGLPETLAKRRSQSTEMVEEFTAALQKSLPETEVIFWDERLTTVQAESVLIQAGTRRKKRKQKVDKIAAALILQNYLDRQSRM
jgi:putative Holliday junction resolvase